LDGACWFCHAHIPHCGSYLYLLGCFARYRAFYRGSLVPHYSGSYAVCLVLRWVPFTPLVRLPRLDCHTTGSSPTFTHGTYRFRTTRCLPDYCYTHTFIFWLVYTHTHTYRTPQFGLFTFYLTFTYTLTPGSLRTWLRTTGSPFCPTPHTRVCARTHAFPYVTTLRLFPLPHSCLWTRCRLHFTGLPVTLIGFSVCVVAFVHILPWIGFAAFHYQFWLLPRLDTAGLRSTARLHTLPFPHHTCRLRIYVCLLPRCPRLYGFGHNTRLTATRHGRCHTFTRLPQLGRSCFFDFDLRCDQTRFVACSYLPAPLFPANTCIRCFTFPLTRRRLVPLHLPLRLPRLGCRYRLFTFGWAGYGGRLFATFYHAHVTATCRLPRWVRGLFTFVRYHARWMGFTVIYVTYLRLPLYVDCFTLPAILPATAVRLRLAPFILRFVPFIY